MASSARCFTIAALVAAVTVVAAAASPVSALTWYADATGVFEFSRNCAFFGNDFGGTGKTRSIQACGVACARTSGCTHFTRTKLGYCLFKNGPRVQRDATSSEGAACGLRIPPRWHRTAGYIWSSQCDFPGNTIGGSATKRSARECGAACAATVGCTNFVRNPKGYCYFKDGCVPARRAIYKARTACGVRKPTEWRTGGAFLWARDCNYFGRGMGGISGTANITACGAACVGTVGCTTFVRSPRGDCAFKNGARDRLDATHAAGIDCGIVRM